MTVANTRLDADILLFQEVGFVILIELTSVELARLHLERFADKVADFMFRQYCIRQPKEVLQYLLKPLTPEGEEMTAWARYLVACL